MFCKRPLVSIYVIILLFFIFSCKNETSIDNLTEGYPPSHDVQNKTFVEIKNNSQYDVNVYYDSNLQHLLTCIPSGKTIKNEVNIENIGKLIYIEYEYKVGSVQIPYFNLKNSGCVKTIPIRENEVNKLELSKLDSLSFDESLYLIFQNKTTDYVYIEESISDEISKELYQNSSEDFWISPQNNVVYEITNINLKNCCVLNGNNSLNLDIGNLKSGRVYTVDYDGKSISIVSIDLGINPQNDLGLPIYTISSVADLKNISKYDNVDAYFELTCNIDGNGTIWKPISLFKGTLQGNNFSIENFCINSCSALGDEEPCGRQFGSDSSFSTEYCRPAFCGFFYENNGKINNIFFKNINVNATFEYQTDDWRYVYVGAVAGRNNGEIINVHLENIQLKSNLNHEKTENGIPHQKNITGGVVGKNRGAFSYISIKNSEIKASTNAKKNRCDTSTYVGGVCGEIGEASNILSINTNVEANSSGGNGSFWGLGDSLQGTNVGDGILNSYAGSVFGGDVFSGSEKFVSYNNSTPRVYTNVLAYNPTTERISSLLGVTDFTVKNSYYISDFASLNNSPILDWENWRIQDGNPENFLD